MIKKLSLVIFSFSVVLLLILGFFLNPFKAEGKGFIGLVNGKTVPYSGFDVVCDHGGGWFGAGWGCFTVGDFQYSRFCRGMEDECIRDTGGRGLRAFEDNGYLCEEVEVKVEGHDLAYVCVLNK